MTISWKYFQLTVFLAFAVLMFGCSNANPMVKPSPGDSDESSVSVISDHQPIQRVASEDNSSIPPNIEDLLPYPWTTHTSIKIFANWGIDSFYALKKRVPNSYEEYRKSGIPMLVPFDYVTGEPYHLVDKIDIEDTAGFTFWSDGVESCTFEFVINSNKTGNNEVIAIEITPENFVDYKITDGQPGIMTNVDYYFDKVKREYCLKAFTMYNHIYLKKHQGTVPSSIYDMLIEEGQPIEDGWKWEPEFGSNEYFEFGVDPGKLRYYTIQGSRKMHDGQPLPMYAQQLFAESKSNHEYQQDVDEWSLTNDFVPEDIIEMTKLISSDSFYDGYLQLVN